MVIVFLFFGYQAINYESQARSDFFNILTGSSGRFRCASSTATNEPT
jgi:hypothetical protein